MKATSQSASDLLFPLQYRGKALALLLLQPQRRLHVREIARLTGTVAGTMNRELDRLQRAGLLEKHRVGNQLQFCANRQHPVFEELSALLRKTIGLTDVLVLALTPLADRVTVAFVFGSIATSSETAVSDVDVIIIGDVEFGEALALLYEAQKTLQREINPKVFSVADWQAKMASNSSFVTDVMAKPKLFLIGNQCELDQLAQPGQNRTA
jgi:predicted nucleotidyltransferase